MPAKILRFTNKNIPSALGLSMLLSGSAPAISLAHEGHDHGEHHGGGYRERQDSSRYDSDEDRWEDEDEDENDADTYRPSSRPYPPPDREQSAPREHRSRPY